MDGSVRQELPLSIPLCINPFEPYRVEPPRGSRAAFWFIQAYIPPVGDYYVRVNLYLDEIKIMDEVFLFLNPLQKCRLVIDGQRFSAVRPCVAVSESEVAGGHTADVGDVAPDDRIFNPAFESQHVGYRIGR